MPQIVPLKPVASQTLQIVLSNQSCTLDVYQQFYGLFIDVLVKNQLIIGGVFCRNLNRIVRSAYLGFAGDFVFYDTQRSGADPNYTGLGSQFQLVYLTPAEVATAVV